MNRKWVGIIGFTFVSMLAPRRVCAVETTGAPSDAYSLYLKALLDENKGDFAGSQKKLEEALSYAPSNAFLNREAAEMAFRLGEFDKASRYIEKTISLEPKNVKNYIIAGQIYWTAGRSADAEAVFKKALDLDPDEAEALVSLAMALTPNDPQKAIDLYVNYLSRHPRDVEIEERLAQLYQATNNVPEAKKAWAKVLEISPDSLRAHLASAQIAEVEQDTQTAIMHYDVVLDQDPSNLALLLRVGELRYRSNDIEKAKELFSKAQAVAPDSATANFWLALVAESNGDWPEAIRLLRPIADKTSDPALRLRLSYYYAQAGNKKESIRILATLSKQEPENMDYLMYLAVAYEQSGDTKNAIKTLEAMIAIDSENSEHYFSLATLYDRKGDFAKSESYLKQALAINPDDDMTLNYLAYSYAERSLHLDDAEVMASKAVQLDPQNGAYLDTLGWVCFKRGQYVRAENFLVEASSRMVDPVMRAHLGEVRVALGNFSGAVVAFNDSLRLDPEQKKVVRKRNWCFQKLSLSEKARVSLVGAQQTFGAVLKAEGLMGITVKQGWGSKDATAEFLYIKGDTFLFEMPGALGGSLLRLEKKPGADVIFESVHPAFLSVKEDAVQSFLFINAVVDGQIFDDARYPIADVRLKNGLLNVEKGAVSIGFNRRTGQLVSFKNAYLGQELNVAWGGDVDSAFWPSAFVWRGSANSFRLSYKFRKPVLRLSPGYQYENRSK